MTRQVISVDWRAWLTSMVWCVALLVVLAGAGCEGASPREGGLGERCFDNGSCDVGLTCDADFRCVDPSGSPCWGVTCLGPGTCAAVDTDAVACVCDEGYHHENLGCLINDAVDPCQGVTCEGHGTCTLLYGEQPVCQCDPGYHEIGTLCVRNDDRSPCLGVGCAAVGVGSCDVDAQGMPRCTCDEGLELVGTTCREPWRARWRRLNPSAYPPQADHMALVYDAARQRVVAHYTPSASGNATALTWELDGDVWSPVATAQTPPPRIGHAMAYDAQRERVVLFGGLRTDDGSALADTWEYDGLDWHRVATSATPMARTGHAMAYHGGLGQILMTGGHCAEDDSCDNFQLFDTLVYNGVTWIVHIQDGGPGGYQSYSATYAPAQDRMYAYGGHPTPLCDTSSNYLYYFEGTFWSSEWSEPELAVPAAMAWEPDQQLLVLFGKDCVTGEAETWTYDGAQFRLLSLPESPTPRIGGGMVYDAAHRRMVLLGGQEAAPETQLTWILRLSPLWPAAGP